MATIRKRGDRWEVQIRKKGQAPISKSFLMKSDAHEWGRYMEQKAGSQQYSGIGKGPPLLAGLFVNISQLNWDAWPCWHRPVHDLPQTIFPANSMNNAVKLEIIGQHLRF